MYLGEFKYLGEFSFILIFFVPYCVFSCLLSCVCPCQFTLISLTAVLWSSAPSPNPPTSGVVLSYISYVLLLLPFLFFFCSLPSWKWLLYQKKKKSQFLSSLWLLFCDLLLRVGWVVCPWPTSLQVLGQECEARTTFHSRTPLLLSANTRYHCLQRFL